MTTLEQRHDSRSLLHATQVSLVDVESGVEFAASGKNLSSGGVAFHADLEPALGADMRVSVGGARPVEAELKVVRVERSPEGGFDVAGRLVRAR
jgi:hypothetical protein